MDYKQVTIYINRIDQWYSLSIVFILPVIYGIAHRCPLPTGWWIKRGVSDIRITRYMLEHGITNRPLYSFAKGHHWCRFGGRLCTSKVGRLCTSEVGRLCTLLLCDFVIVSL